MKIYVLSDLHLEFAGFNPPQSAIEAADVIVLAGDIDADAGGIYWARKVFDGKPVVYVAGNHEFYGGHWTGTLENLRAAAAKEGVHFLEDDEVVIDGVRFLGSALWTDFAYFGDQHLAAAMSSYARDMNDCRCISATPELPVDQGTGQTCRLTPDMVLARHVRSRAWLQERLQLKGWAKTVVVTHHGPSAESVAPRWANDWSTPGFVSRLPAELIAGADVWVHGHTHDSHDYMIEHECVPVRGEDGGVGRTRVVVNPRGYPRDRRGSAFENLAFRSGLLIEV